MSGPNLRGSGFPPPDNTSLLTEIRDAIIKEGDESQQLLEDIKAGYDVEYLAACDISDPQNKEAIYVKTSNKKADGLEDLSKREYLKNGMQMATPPTAITWAACGEDALKEFTFSVTPNLEDNTEEDYTTTVNGVLEADNYTLIHNIPLNNGIEIVGCSWIDNNVTVTIYNNTGQPINSELNFILKQV